MTLPWLNVKQRWTPARVGPALWIEARKPGYFYQSGAGTTAVTDGSVCGFAGDISPNAFNLTSTADDTTRPTWNFNSGNSYLLFNGTNQLLRRTSALGLYAGGPGLTIGVAIMGGASIAAAKTLLADASTGGSNPQYDVANDATTATTGRAIITNDSGTGLISGTNVNVANVFDTTTPHVWVLTDDTATFETYLNGASSSSFGYTRSGTFTGNVFTLGAIIRNTTSAWMNVRVYSVIIVKRVLVGSELTFLTKYLGKTCGLNL